MHPYRCIFGILRISIIDDKPSLIFFVYPDPKGSEENQFTPPGDGVNKLIFKRYLVSFTGVSFKIFIR